MGQHQEMAPPETSNDGVTTKGTTFDAPTIRAVVPQNPIATDFNDLLDLCREASLQNRDGT